jgi:hypothetical protein
VKIVGVVDASTAKDVGEKFSNIFTCVRLNHEGLPR